MNKLIDISKFYDSDALSPAISTPWIIGGKAYASNGIVLIEIERDRFSSFVTNSEIGRHDGAKLLEPIDSISTWHAWPKIEMCEMCKNTWEFLEDCGECGGTGRDHLTSEVCDVCYGDAKITYWCNCFVMFGNRKIAREYAALFSDLPGVEWGVVDTGTEIYDLGAFVRFDGGRGLIAGLRKGW